MPERSQGGGDEKRRDPESGGGARRRSWRLHAFPQHWNAVEQPDQ